MNIREQLLSEISRKNIDFTIHTLGNDKNHFKELIDIILNEKDPLPMRASWVVEGITSRYPEMIIPYMKPLIKNLRKFTHTGTQRNLLKTFSMIKIDEKYHGELVDICFEWLAKEDMPVAVKVFSMQIIANIIHIYPELKNEFLEILDEQIPRNSAGFRSRARKIKMEIGKI